MSFRSWIFKINKKIVSLTELMAGVKAPSKTCQLFQLMCWPQGYKVSETGCSLTELMAGVKAPSKTCQLFQLMCWPQGYKVS